MTCACAARRHWLSAILILTLALTTVATVRAEALLWAVESNPANGVNIANAVAADGTGLYVVGVETHPYGVEDEPHARQWRVEKRNSMDGSLVWASALPDRSTLPSAASAVAMDGSGVYVAGFDASHGLRDTEWRIERRRAVDGSVMWTVTSNPTPGIDEASAVAIDSSGLYVVGIEEYDPAPLFDWRIEKRSLGDGSLVWNATSRPREFNLVWGVAVDDSGIYVVGESTVSPGNTEWRIEKRRLTDGSMIWNATSHPSMYARDSARAVAVDATGFYVVGVDQPVTGGFEWRVEKRNLSDGSLVWNATSYPTVGNNWASQVAIDSSGIYMAGSDQSPGNEEWRVEKRRLFDGSLIWNATSNPSPRDAEANGVAVDASGVYAVGFDQSPDNFQWRIERRSLTDGSLVWTATSNPGTGADEATGIAVDGSGVYVAGYDMYCIYACYSRWRIEKRSLTDGSVVWTRTGHPTPFLDSPGAAAVDGTGVYVVGYEGMNVEKGTLGQWRIEKRSLTDGSLTWAQVLTDPDIPESQARGVAADGSGVYVVGFQKSYRGPEWRVEKRRLTDGSLMWNVTSSRIAEVAPGALNLPTFGVAVDDSGVYVAGPDVLPGNSEWRIEKRRLTDGSLMWNVTSNPSPGEDVPTGLAVDQSAIYVVGTDLTPSDAWEWRIEKRRLTDGAVLWNMTSHPSIGRDAAQGVAVDGSGIYVVGNDESQGPDNFEWRIEKRHLADGSLMWNATSKPTSGASEAYAVAADASGIYVAGYDSSTYVHEWRIEKRELGPPVPPPGPSMGGLLLFITAVPVAIAVLGAAAILVRRDAYAGGLPRRTERRPAMVCPRCHRPLIYHALHHKWYCSSCMTYV